MFMSNRFLFMFLVFTAILLPHYGCGGGESGGVASTPPASQPFTLPASQPSVTEYSPSGSISSCSAPSLLTDYRTNRSNWVVFIDETGNEEGSYTFCFLASVFLPSYSNNTVLASCGSFASGSLENRAIRLDMTAEALSANVARVFSTGTGWDGGEWDFLSTSSTGTIRLTNGYSRLRIENYRVTFQDEVNPLWFDGGCYDPFSESAILTENADSEETLLSEILSAMDEFLSSYDPDNSDVDGDFDGLDTDLGRIETNGSEIEE